MSQTVQLDENLIRVSPPSDDRRHLETLVVMNPNADPIYLNLWDDTATSGAPGQAIATVMDQFPIAGASSLTLFVNRIAAGSFVFSASTARDGTGAPAVDVEIGALRWLVQ